MRSIAERPRAPLPTSARYGVAIGVAILATVISAAFSDVLEPLRFVVLWAAVSVAALFGGTGPGMLAGLLCTAGAALTAFEPTWSLDVANPIEALRLVLFALVALLIAYATGLRRTAQQSAQDLRDWLTTTLRSIGDAVIATDNEGRIVFVNRAAEDVTGFAAAEWMDQKFDTVFHLLHEESCHPIDDPVGRVLASGVAVTLAARTALVRKDGTRVPIDDSAAPIRGEFGKLLGVVIVFRDVTTKREAQRTLEESERTFRNLADTAPVLIWMSDAAGRCTFVNRAWLDFTGKSFEQELGDGWRSTVHPDDLARITASTESARDAVRPMELEYRMLRHDGEYRWVIDRSLPRRDPAGTYEGCTGSIVDITERRETEDARSRLLQAQTAARASAEAAQQRATFLAEVASILASSLDYEEALRTFGRLTVQSVADWCFVDLATESGQTDRLVIAHADAYNVRRARELTLAGQLPLGLPRVSAGAASRAEIVRIGEATAPAAWRELGINAAATVPLLARDRILGTITIATESSAFTAEDVALIEEVGRRAAIAIDNARLYSLALQANRAKDEFLATLSHELRTPLTAILGWAKMLRMGNLEPENEALAIDTIERSARVQAELIEDLLDVSRIITGKLKLDIKPASIADVVMDVASSLRPAADAKDVAISLDIPSEVPAIAADARRLRQIVWNLMSNAIKFGRRSGHVRVKIAPADGALRFTVADDGIGISREFLPHVFERFRQADSTASRQHGGLGLGLAIVKELVELHGGSVRAESEGDNFGTTFIVDLPIDLDAVAAAERTGAGSGRADFRLEGRRVLVVDDQDDARQVVKAMLELHGADVATAADASEALAKFELWHPEIVVSDLAMSGEDGYSLAARIRSSPANGRIPLIALTALAEPDEGARVSKSGFDRLLRKPVTPTQLATAVSELLGALVSS